MPASTIGLPVLIRLAVSFMKSKLRSQVVPDVFISFACNCRASIDCVVSVTPETDLVSICRSASGPTASRIFLISSNGFSPR